MNENLIVLIGNNEAALDYCNKYLYSESLVEMNRINTFCIFIIGQTVYVIDGDEGN